MVLFCLFPSLVSGVEAVVICQNSFYTRFKVQHQMERDAAFGRLL